MSPGNGDTVAERNWTMRSSAEDSTTTRVLSVPRFARQCQIVDNLTLHLDRHIHRRRKPRRLTDKSMWATAIVIILVHLYFQLHWVL